MKIPVDIPGPIMAQSFSLDTTSACMSQVGIQKAIRRTLAHTLLGSWCRTLLTHALRILDDSAAMSLLPMVMLFRGLSAASWETYREALSCHRIDSTTLDRIDGTGYGAVNP